MYEYDAGIVDAIEAGKEDILSKANVVGIGLGIKEKDGKKTDRLSAVILVEEKKPLSALADEDILPKYLFGPGNVSEETDVIAVGKLVALKTRTEKWRPAPGGVSVGHFNITAGTLGVAAIDNITGKKVILSNNHVLANSNDAMIGDAILQPGYIDGGRLEHSVIGYLLRYKEIDFGEEPADCPVAEGVAKVMNVGAKVFKSSHRLNTVKTNLQAVNYVDAAIAEPVSQDLLDEEILDIGAIDGIIDVSLGVPIRKSGRTTEYTHGSVMLVEATVTVGYGGGKVARFERQVIGGNMSAPGDSGSLGVHEDSNKAFGLLYAGSDQVTIFNPIREVLSVLMISL